MMGGPTVANMIKHRRQSIGMTIRELSERTGIAVGYLSDLENDGLDLFNPTKKVMDKIADALGSTVPDVFYANTKASTFGDNLRRALKRKRMTSKELAKLLDVSPVYISYLLTNRRTPSYGLIQKMGVVLEDRMIIDAANI